MTCEVTLSDCSGNSLVQINIDIELNGLDLNGLDQFDGGNNFIGFPLINEACLYSFISDGLNILSVSSDASGTIPLYLASAKVND